MGRRARNEDKKEQAFSLQSVAVPPQSWALSREGREREKSTFSKEVKSWVLSNTSCLGGSEQRGATARRLRVC